MEGIPLKIFVSTRTGRRYLCLYHKRGQRLANLRLDSIKKLVLMDSVPSYEEYQHILSQNLSKVFGVSFGNVHTMDYIKLTLSIHEPTENFILKRLEREGRNGRITRVAENIYTYEAEVFDGNEMIPWIKTFTGRILYFDSNNSYLKRKFYQDIQRLAAMYNL